MINIALVRHLDARLRVSEYAGTVQDELAIHGTCYEEKSTCDCSAMVPIYKPSRPS